MKMFLEIRPCKITKYDKTVQYLGEPCQRKKIACFLMQIAKSWSEYRPRGYKTFFMLYSIEYEIVHAH